MMTSSLSRAAAAFVLLSLGAACGMSIDASATDTGDGGSTDPGSQAGGESGASSGNGGSTTGHDAGSATNGGDAGSTADAASMADAASKTPTLNLGTAGQFAILSKGGVSVVPTAAILGNLGVSPAAATYITGLSLSADATNVFSTSTQVTGKVYAADYALPTPTKLTTAIGDMELAFTDAAARAPDFLELGAGDIGGMTLAPGVYRWATGVLIPATITLSGNANDVWIFQIAQTLSMATATRVLLKGGAVPRNVFWQVAGFVQLGTTAHLEGSILTQTSITLGTGASLEGRLLAQTSVDLAAGAVVHLAPSMSY